MKLNDAEPHYIHTGAGLAELKEHTEGALPILMVLAEHGDMKSQYAMGEAYLRGWGVEQDFLRAAEWYLKAAEKGHAPSQATLGAMYLDGLGVTRDYAQGRHWLKKAARQGDEHAEYSLGKMYSEGAGVAVDHQRAFSDVSARGQKGAARGAL